MCLNSCANRAPIPVREGVVDETASQNKAAQDYEHPKQLLQLLATGRDMCQAMDCGRFQEIFQALHSREYSVNNANALTLHIDSLF